MDDYDDTPFSWLMVFLPVGWFAVVMLLVSCPRSFRIPLWGVLNLGGAIWLWSLSTQSATALLSIVMVMLISWWFGHVILEAA